MNLVKHKFASFGLGFPPTPLVCGEVYQLKRNEVFLDKGYLKVTKGKTKTSIRRVPLSDSAREILSARLAKFDGENLFPHNDIDGMNATSCLNVVHKEVVDLLGLKFRLYDCRHTFATRAVESGVDLVVLASILGHSNLKMLTGYAHPSESMKMEAIKKMSKIA
jgi:integrase